MVAMEYSRLWLTILIKEREEEKIKSIQSLQKEVMKWQMKEHIETSCYPNIFHLINLASMAF